MYNPEMVNALKPHCDWCSGLENDLKRLGPWEKPTPYHVGQAHKTTENVLLSKLKMNLSL